MSHTGPRHEFPGTTTGQRGASLVPELLVKHPHYSHNPIRGRRGIVVGNLSMGGSSLKPTQTSSVLGFYFLGSKSPADRNTWPSGWRRCIPRAFHGISVVGNATS